MDGDGDGVRDCDDGCPGDPAKSAPGICGCGVPDTPRCGAKPPEDLQFAGGSAIGITIDCSAPMTEADFNVTRRQVCRPDALQHCPPRRSPHTPCSQRSGLTLRLNRTDR